MCIRIVHQQNLSRRFRLPAIADDRRNPVAEGGYDYREVPHKKDPAV
jgi:hypothetical protein